MVGFDVLSQSGVIQHCTERQYLRPYFSVGCAVGQALLLISGDVAGVQFVQRNIEPLAPPFEQDAPRIPPEGSGFANGHCSRDLIHAYSLSGALSITACFGVTRSG